MTQVDENDRRLWWPSDENAGAGDSNASLKVNMNHIDLTQDALDQLSGCLANIKLLITVKGRRTIFDQQQVSHDATSSSLNFVELKKLRKFVLDINHFILSGNKTGHLFIQLVYGQGDDKEEACYRLVLKDRQQDYRFSPTTKESINQPRGNTNSQLITMHFYEKLEEFVITDSQIATFCTTVYARIIGSELQRYNEGFGRTKWFDNH